MKVTPRGPGVINAYKSQNDQNKNMRKNRGTPGMDRAEISSVGRELQTYRAALKQMPDVRQDQVSEIKSRIKNGTYTPSAEKIAEGIIRESRLDTKV
ncbi:flagellar biosynthesis anti-sigma factor FlgM [Desulfoscipio sp. XC116]|uniref:flagellar biosynthesis anti-sigma factor FlgM n=1 Tax=Desulfoscipio sp. XC116 TaxID=3144975 RepID=UPI00325B4EE5